MIGVEALQRLDQAQRRDLLEVLERHAATTVVAPGDRVGEREISPDQPLTSLRVTAISVRAEVRRVTTPIGLTPRAAVPAPGRACSRVAGSSLSGG